MQILGNTKSFFNDQSTIVDNNVDEYLNKSIDDQYGLLFQLAQDVTMEDMINAQYWYQGMKFTGGKFFLILSLIRCNYWWWHGLVLIFTMTTWI